MPATAPGSRTGSGLTPMPETVDAHRLACAFPPDDPRYTLRRVAEQGRRTGYYYGFANEDCGRFAILRTRANFSRDDWQHYQEVNQKFTAAVLEEIEDIPSPVILVQDYHFALMPRMIKRNGQTRAVAIFWHNPVAQSEKRSNLPVAAELVMACWARTSSLPCAVALQ